MIPATDPLTPIAPAHSALRVPQSALHEPAVPSSAVHPLDPDALPGVTHSTPDGAACSGDTHQLERALSLPVENIPAGSSSSQPSTLDTPHSALRVPRLNRRWAYAQWLRLSAIGLNREQASKEIGCCPVTLWRLIADVEQYGEAAFQRKKPTGTTSQYAYLLKLENVRAKLREIHTATLGASCDAMTNNRRTGNYSATLKAFTLEPECPDSLKPKLLRGNFPVCFIRFLGQLTPELEALIRGPKHFQLNGPSGRREKLIGLPDGSRAYLPAGYVIELDDMSVNQPFWAEGPDGQPILSRQGLYARCVTGRWLYVDLISRPREAYRSEDILRFIRRLFELYGKPKKLRIERSVWAAHNISGFKLVSEKVSECVSEKVGDDMGGGPSAVPLTHSPTHPLTHLPPLTDGEFWQEEECGRPSMSEADRQNLSLGLMSLGIEVEYCRSARGKADLEGAFDPLQTNLAIFSREFPNIGRHAGEFERMAKQLRRVRAGSHHPRDLGFPHQQQLLQKILATFDYMNGVLLDANGKTKDEIWTHDTNKWKLPPLARDDLAVFLPVRREREISGGAIYPVVDRREFCFRAMKFAELGDGYKVWVTFDPSEPSLGAAIYNREGRNSSNHQNYAEGDFICWAAHDVPACTTYAAEVPEDLPRWTLEELHGPGATANGGGLLKEQTRALRNFVRSAGGGRLPGQPVTKAIEQRGPSQSEKAGGGSVISPTHSPTYSPADRLCPPPPTADQRATRARSLRSEADELRSLYAETT